MLTYILKTIRTASQFNYYEIQKRLETGYIKEVSGVH